jgi:hypothetical protein
MFQTPIKFQEHSESVVKSTPFLRQRELAAEWAERNGADVFAFYAGGTRGSVFISADNTIKPGDNSISTGPVAGMKIREIKRIIKSL